VTTEVEKGTEEIDSVNDGATTETEEPTDANAGVELDSETEANANANVQYEGTFDKLFGYYERLKTGYTNFLSFLK
jgi:hypothetical protein